LPCGRWPAASPEKKSGAQPEANWWLSARHDSGLGHNAFVPLLTAAPREAARHADHARLGLGRHRGGTFTSLAGVSYPTAAVASKALASISFPVAGTRWIYLKLAAPWASDASQSGTGASAYAVIDGIVYLTGSMRQPSQARTFTSLDAIAYPQNS
jgi:hypothetical protein